MLDSPAEKPASGAVANLELEERPAVLFPSSPPPFLLNLHTRGQRFNELWHAHRVRTSTFCRTTNSPKSDFGGYGERCCITVPPCPDIIWGNIVPQKYLFPAFPIRQHHWSQLPFTPACTYEMKFFHAERILVRREKKYYLCRQAANIVPIEGR